MGREAEENEIEQAVTELVKVHAYTKNARTAEIQYYFCEVQ